MVNTCPICDNNGARFSTRDRTATTYVDCPQCGDYAITEECIGGISFAEERDPLLRRRIRRYLHEHQGEGLLLSSAKLSSEQTGGKPSLDLESASALYTQEGSPLEKYERTLAAFAENTKRMGESFSSDEDWWLVSTMHDDEACEIIEELIRDGYLVGATGSEGVWEARMTSKGLKYAQQAMPQGAAHESPDGEAKNGDMPTVFLSHSHSDNEFTERLASDLERQGITVWYDGWDLDIGHDLTIKIQEGIHGSQFLAVILSPSAVQSAWVEKEWTTAFMREVEGRKVVVLPILYQDCDMPEFLRAKKYADFRYLHDYEVALADLVRCVRGESKRPPISSSEAPIQQEYAHTIKVSFQGQDQIRKGNALSIARWYGPEGPGGNGKLRVAIMADLTDDASYKSDLVGSTVTIVPVEVPIKGRVAGTIERSHNETTFDLEMTEEEFQKYLPHRQVRKSL